MPSAEGRDSIIAGAVKYAPTIAEAKLELHTACLRPVAADGLPIVGPVGDAANLFVANGAGKKGVLLSPVLAEMMTALVLGEPERAPVPAEFSTARFGL